MRSRDVVKQFDLQELAPEPDHGNEINAVRGIIPMLQASAGLPGNPAEEENE